MLNIDSKSSKPIYEQIVDGIKEAIIKTLLKPGDKLPSVRELSLQNMVNPNTVSKAYMELERQKVIETIRGKGTFVSTNYQPRIDEDRMRRMQEDLKKIIVEAHYMGLEKQEINVMVSEIYQQLEGEPRNDPN